MGVYVQESPGDDRESWSGHWYDEKLVLGRDVASVGHARPDALPLELGDDTPDARCHCNNLFVVDRHPSLTIGQRGRNVFWECECWPAIQFSTVLRLTDRTAQLWKPFVIRHSLAEGVLDLRDLVQRPLLVLDQSQGNLFYRHLTEVGMIAAAAPHCGIELC